MTNTVNLDVIAESLAYNVKTRTRVEIDQSALVSRQSAYETQDLMVAKLGEVAGWKVGRAKTNPEPYCAPILKQLVLPNLTTYSAPKGLAAAKLEAEVAFIVGEDISMGHAPLSTEECFSAIRGITPAIEILESRLHAEQASDANSKLADFQGNGAVILGEEILWNKQDLRKVTLSIETPNKPRQTSMCSHPFGDPGQLLMWQMNHIISYRSGLKEGDFIITGSYCGILDIDESGFCRFGFKNIGEVGIQIQAN